MICHGWANFDSLEFQLHDSGYNIVSFRCNFPLFFLQLLITDILLFDAHFLYV